VTVRRLQPAWRFSRNELSGKAGAVQLAMPLIPVCVLPTSRVRPTNRPLS
jgi:hypothetical protein